MTAEAAKPAAKPVKIERKTDLARSGSMFPVDLT